MKDTCKATRALMSTTSPLGLTRGHRASIVGHLMECPACTEWLMAVTGRPVLEGEYPDVDAMAAEDNRDPEYTDTVHPRIAGAN